MVNEEPTTNLRTNLKLLAAAAALASASFVGGTYVGKWSAQPVSANLDIKDSNKDGTADLEIQQRDGTTTRLYGFGPLTNRDGNVMIEYTLPLESEPTKVHSKMVGQNYLTAEAMKSIRIYTIEWPVVIVEPVEEQEENIIPHSIDDKVETK